MQPAPKLPEIVPVILAGGEGRRLRPLSRPDCPKPFLKFPGFFSLFQATVKRAAMFGNPVIVCHRRHRDLVLAQMAEIGIPPRRILLEPEPKNTAAAIAAVAALMEHENPLLLFLPSDHTIRNLAAFHTAIGNAAGAAAQQGLVTFGIKPHYPASHFGYIHMGDCIGTSSARAIARFTEKPPRHVAREFLRTGAYVWNSGIFLVSARTCANLLGNHAPDVLNNVRTAVRKARAVNESILLDPGAFTLCPAGSFDRLVMEKVSNAAVVPVDMGWNDLGTWGGLFREIMSLILRRDLAYSVRHDSIDSASATDSI